MVSLGECRTTTFGHKSMIWVRDGSLMVNVVIAGETKGDISEINMTEERMSSDRGDVSRGVYCSVCGDTADGEENARLGEKSSESAEKI